MGVTYFWNATKDGQTTTYTVFGINPGNPPIKIIPWSLPKSYASPTGTRLIRANWVKKCAVCHSEGHWMEEKCPWLFWNFNGNSLNLTIARKLEPGQYKQRKRPKDTSNLDFESLITDCRFTEPDAANE